MNAFLRLRTAERAVVILSAAAALALATPLFGWGWGAAIWLGLPRSLWWVIGWLLTVFVSLVVAHITEPVDAEPTAPTAAHEHPASGDWT